MCCSLSKPSNFHISEITDGVAYHLGRSLPHPALVQTVGEVTEVAPKRRLEVAATWARREQEACELRQVRQVPTTAEREISN